MMSNLLEIRELSIKVKDQELIHDLDLTIPEGEVHALLGPNGCGKSTLLMTIMGFPTYEVTKGRILFDGRDIGDLDITERARLGIGVAQQRPPTLSGIALQDVIDYALTGNPQLKAAVDRMIDDYQMKPFLGRDINAGLSGGEIKRAELFQLLITHPRFAMLDEPDSGIDLESLALVGQMVNALLSKDPSRLAKRRTALIITHSNQILDYVPIDKAYIMLDGRIGCSGNPHILIREVREHGYEGCIACLQAAQESTI
jgi:Fe-S cluster assembly ATP-binding protein